MLQSVSKSLPEILPKKIKLHIKILKIGRSNGTVKLSYRVEGSVSFFLKNNAI